jgi:DNA-binding CsgD family transcriptional regulator
MESLVACINDPIALVKGDGLILWGNRELSALDPAASSESLQGRPYSDIVPAWPSLSADPELALPGRHLRRAALAAGGDAVTRPVRLHIARCHPDLGAAWAIHLQSEEEVHALRQRLTDRERSNSFLQANTSDLILRTDEQLVITWANEAALRLFPLGESLAARLTEASVEALRSGTEPRFDVALESSGERSDFFLLRGVARRLPAEEGRAAGLSLLLHDDSEEFRLARFSVSLGLSPREEEVMQYIARGYTNLNIAAILGLSESGVKFHVRNVFARAKVNTRTELMAQLLGVA